MNTFNSTNESKLGDSSSEELQVLGSNREAGIALAQTDPTGASEYESQYYTNLNSELVRQWRVAEASGLIATTGSMKIPL